jgi:membrane protease YdiL (CAAX protease family)
VFSNALKEEIQFRGLFIIRFEPQLGAGTSNFLQALIFTLPHLGEVYSTAFPVFLCIVFLLGLGFGVFTQKTDSILASVLFHTGANISVILGIFSNIWKALVCMDAEISVFIISYFYLLQNVG